MDLSVCNNEIIEINYQLNLSKVNMSIVNYYSELGIDIFNKDNFLMIYAFHILKSIQI